MANISKNIKRLRTEKGITQEAFSKLINVSRQAVSSWETGRTQPDIEMLGSLAEALDVSIEELIYGERRNVKIDNEEKNYASTATIIMSIFGGLLLFAGVILILIWCWEHIPVIGKTVFCLVPMVLGIGCAGYTFIKHRADSFMLELGAAAATVGNVVSLIFIDQLFALEMGAVKISIIGVILVLPFMFVFKSTVALTAVYGMAAVMYQSYFFSGFEFGAIGILWAVYLMTGIVFTALYRKSLGFSRYRYAQWISLLSVVWFIYISYVEEWYLNPFIPLISIFTVCYLAENEDDFFSPLFIFGTLGNMIALLSHLLSGCDLNAFAVAEESISIVIFAIILATGLYVHRSRVKTNSFKKWQVIIFVLSTVVSAVQSLVCAYALENEPLISLCATVTTFALSVCIFASSIAFIIQGLKNNRLYPLNLGFISIAVMTLILLSDVDMDMLIKGCILLMMGGVLIFMNLKITKNKQEDRKTEDSSLS